MGYDIEEYLKYEKKYSTARKALEYLYILHLCCDGDKDKIIAALKDMLKKEWSEFRIKAIIEAIKIAKRNLKTKTGIINDI